MITWHLTDVITRLRREGRVDVLAAMVHPRDKGSTVAGLVVHNRTSGVVAWTTDGHTMRSLQRDWERYPHEPITDGPVSPVMAELARRREELGLSLRTLGERCGMSHETIHRLEQGSGRPHLDHVERLADAMGLRVMLAPVAADGADARRVDARAAT